MERGEGGWVDSFFTAYQLVGTANRGGDPWGNFEWSCLSKGDRAAVEGFFSFEFIRQTENLVFIGKNGLGKSMLARNLGHAAARAEFSSYFVDAFEKNAVQASERRGDVEFRTEQDRRKMYIY